MADDVIAIMNELLQKEAQILSEKMGQALTEDEKRTIKAAEFLRKIAPFAFGIEIPRQ